jgi:predicted N-acetyltransferase YhbS
MAAMAAEDRSESSVASAGRHATPAAFMLVELQPGYLHGATGTARFHAAFRDV